MTYATLVSVSGGVAHEEYSDTPVLIVDFDSLPEESIDSIEWTAHEIERLWPDDNRPTEVQHVLDTVYRVLNDIRED